MKNINTFTPIKKEEYEGAYQASGAKLTRELITTGINEFVMAGEAILAGKISAAQVVEALKNNPSFKK